MQYLQKVTNQIFSPLCLPPPKISVIVPLYNAEEYIGECLDSILLQTFQSFEVIVVDDCSTDNSVAIVESYIEKFDGRLQLTKTEVNSGGGGYIPRNIGLSLANGEYVIFVDADDFILLSALEILYNAAKEYDTDVVYTSVYYDMKKPNTLYIHKDGLALKLRKEGIEDKTTLTINDTDKLFYELLLPGSGSGEGNFPHPWSKFVRRDFLLKNQIVFPKIITGGDGIWVINIYAYAKRFLRLTIPFYFYRRYNGNSISRMAQKTNSEQLSYYVSGLVLFLKAVYDLANKAEVLKENPVWCYEAVRGRYFEEILKRTDEARRELSSQEIYEILYRELGNTTDWSYLTLVPFFFSVVDNERKTVQKNLQTIGKLQKEVEQIKTSLTYPAISIVIPLYNATEYVSECLDSLLDQTFQNFEVIMVDDCSTDNSVNIVKSYMPKFDGRLKLYHTEKNHGTGAVARSKGLSLSCGEYIYSMDNDDLLTKTALEELYSLAKKYDADVVYCEKYYMSTGVGEEFVKNIHPAVKKIQKPPYVTKPTFIPNDPVKRFKEIMDKRFWPAPWCKLVRREVIIKNELFFPALKISDDDIWTFGLVFCAKRFLRVPNAVYIRRMRETSITGISKTPQQTLSFWLNPILLGLKDFDNILRKQAFFEKNIEYRYAALKEFVDIRFNIFINPDNYLSQEAFYETIEKNFGKELGEYDVLIPVLCTALYNAKKLHNDDTQLIRNLSPYITARMDIKLIPKRSNSGNFQIVSVSDNNAYVRKPKFLQKDGIGYQIQSYEGKIKLVAKATADGQIQIYLRGMDIRDPEANNRRIPYWIDYTAFTVNGTTIFDKLTPTWHDKPFQYNMEVTADEEIVLDVEWLPHRSDVVAVEENYNHQALLKKANSLEKQLTATETNLKAEIETLQDKTVALESLNDNYAQMFRNFSPYLTARIDIRLISETKGGKLRILSVSDSNAGIVKPRWFRKKESGYSISSCVGKLKIVAQSTVDGKVQLYLRGKNVPDPEDKNKRIPYWIDYTAFTVNDAAIFDELTPTWHDKPYTYVTNVTADEEIILEVEWLPHKSDAVVAEENYNHQALLEKANSLEEQLTTTETNLKAEIETLQNKTVELESLNDNYAQMFRNFSSYLTARIDIRFIGKTAGGKLQILSVSDSNADIIKPKWFRKKESGYSISSCVGKLKIVARSTVDGKVQLYLRGKNVPDPEDKDKRIPYWIDYTAFVVNETTIFNERTPAWHDKPFHYNMEITADEEIVLEVEWLPHISDT